MLHDLLQSGVRPLVDELRSIRHDIHQHPELGFEEVRTQSKVRAWLEKHGYQPCTSAETGLVADLHPGRAGQGKTIALRADLDCLPMHEGTDLPYRSVHDNRAHKCGHDGHTAILMGVAAVLAQHRDHVPGNVRLLFQPAEEGVRGGGARVMVAEGVLENVAEVYGLHNWPAFPKGQVRVTGGAMMAQVHGFTLKIRGVGGHGSQPQLTKDPIVAGAHLVTALQTIVSRNLGWRGGAVVSVGAFLAGQAENVIPGEAVLRGTIRTFHPELTERVIERLHAVVAGCRATFDVEIDVDLVVGYPVLVNHPECAEAVRVVAERELGGDQFSQDDLPITGGEDFAYMTQAVPGAYFLVGAERPGGHTPMCHHPDFDFDDDLIPIGMRMFLGLVADRLAT